MDIPFEPADLAQNREGRISSAQRNALALTIRGAQYTMWIPWFVIASLVLVAANMMTLRDSTGWFAGAILDAIALVIMIIAVRVVTRRRLAQLDQDTVESMVSTLQEARQIGLATYAVRFGGRSMIAGRSVIETNRAELQERPQRVFFLAKSNRVIGIVRD